MSDRKLAALTHQRVFRYCDDHGFIMSAIPPYRRCVDASAMRPSSPTAGTASDVPITVEASLKQSKKKGVGEYIFGPTLGEGSYGKVKLAHHAITGEKVGAYVVCLNASTQTKGC
jgi:hypothetical protein